MCTVTFVPYKEHIFLTSNRDEKSTRGRALPPAIHQQEDGALLFPKDVNAGGTWIVAKNTGAAAVLLNGAFQPHVSKSSYRLSRGLVLLHILKEKDPLQCFKNYCCSGIEPFTLILFYNKKLFECRWNGQSKFLKTLSIHKAHIWSSATLYSAEVREKREQWFQNWLTQKPLVTQQEIFKFHKCQDDGDTAEALLMNRNNEVYTVSITTIAINQKDVKLHYWDAIDDVARDVILPIT